jgi:NADPH:quinone reductase-like Zn-dependent oxidoreductase
VILVLGGNGKVGQAAIQIASWRGARVIAVTRRNEPYEGHASAAVAMIDSSSVDVPARVLELSDGHGADIVFNTVGDPYYAAGTASLARRGRQIFIAAVHRVVEFDIFAFYRGRHTYVGIDSLALSSVETAELLRELAPGFSSGQLRPFPILSSAVYALGDSALAYAAVSGSARDRVLLRPDR